MTFYRFPRPGMLRKWYEESPPGFSFAVKVPRLITHYKRFRDVDRLLSDFYGTLQEGLAEKAGPVLFQLPAATGYSPQILESILSAMDPKFQNAVEFRHPGWWQKKVFRTLAAQGVSFCGSSFPELPDVPIINYPVVYYRFHGVPVLYRSVYRASKLQEIASPILKSRKARTVFVYFNNTATAAALRNALAFKRLVEKREKSGRLA